MLDFLTFKTFISQDALILFYYFGAVILPLFAWLLAKKLLNLFGSLFPCLQQQLSSTQQSLWQQLPFHYRLLLITLFVFAFFMIELFWRMLFEFLIAYLQMRDALLASQEM